MNHYPMHPGDYLRDTSHLSLIEDAIYRRAIDWLYINERPLPADIKKAARLLRGSIPWAFANYLLLSAFR